MSLKQYASFLNAVGNQEEGGELWYGVFGAFGKIEQQNDIWEVTNGYENYPVETTTWYGSRAFCSWREAGLPTEIEWEYAARGPDGLIFPWGNEFVPENTVYWDNSQQHAAEIGGMDGDLSWVGAFDMAGNVTEFTADLCLPYPLKAKTTSSDGAVIVGDCVMARGGSYISQPIRNTYRQELYPTSKGYVGIRCVHDFGE